MVCNTIFTNYALSIDGGLVTLGYFVQMDGEEDCLSRYLSIIALSQDKIFCLSCILLSSRVFQ